MIARKLSVKGDVVSYVTSDSRPQLVVRTKPPRSRRRQYSYVESVTKLEHGLTQSDLDKAYRLAGNRFGENLRRTFIILDDAVPTVSRTSVPVQMVTPGPVSEVAAGLAVMETAGEARSTSSSTKRGYFTQVFQVSVLLIDNILVLSLTDFHI